MCRHLYHKTCLEHVCGRLDNVKEGEPVHLRCIRCESGESQEEKSLGLGLGQSHGLGQNLGLGQSHGLGQNLGLGLGLDTTGGELQFELQEAVDSD